ncbi:MAG: thiolase family protein [bacterium]|nr:thiolase family protein [bacterium]
MGEAYIVDAARTPIGKRDGCLSAVRPDELAGDLIRERVESLGLDPADIDDVILGCVTQVSEQGGNIARLAILSSGLPIAVSATTVDRQCGSGATALNIAAMGVMSGMQDLVIAGGVESMSRVPMASDKVQFSDRLLARFDMIAQGYSAELVAEKWKLDRHEMAELSFESHTRAAAARDNGEFVREIVPVRVSANGAATVVEHDEGPRSDTSVEKIESLKPAFKEDGYITAANASQISDGAACLVLASGKAVRELDLCPRAKVVGFAYSGVDPTIMLTGPMRAIPKVLHKTGLKLEDVDAIELNEAFMSVVMATRDELGLEMSKTNIRGGAVALGHPLGASGARLPITLLHIMEDRDLRIGLSSLCIGFGDGVATVIERL